MAELLSKPEFRDALEDAIKGREAKNASFSLAWANGELEPRALRPLGREPLPLRRPVRRLPRLHLRQHARPRHRRQGLPPAEHVRGGALRHPPHRPADPLRRGVRHDARARDGHRQHALPSPAACRAGATRPRCASTSPSPPRRSSSASSRRCRRSTAASTRCCSRSTASPRRRPSSSTSTSRRDEIHGERGYQIVLEHADTPELQQRCLQLVRHGAEVRFSYTKALYDTYVAPGRPTSPEPRRRHSPDDVGAGCDADASASTPPTRRSRSPTGKRSTCSAWPSGTSAASRSSAPAATAAPIACGCRGCRELRSRCAGANATASANCSIRGTAWPARRT